MEKDLKTCAEITEKCEKLLHIWKGIWAKILTQAWSVHAIIAIFLGEKRSYFSYEIFYQGFR